MTPSHQSYSSDERRGCGCGNLVIGGLVVLGLLAALVLFLPRDVETDVVIDAPPLVVWSNVIDFEGYASWNPYLKEMSGEAREGGRLKASVVFRDSDPVELHATVDVAREGEELRWSGGLRFPWLFDDDHYVRLEALPRGRCRVVHGATYRGVGPALFWTWLEPAVDEAFEAHNGRLKAASEGR